MRSRSTLHSRALNRISVLLCAAALIAATGQALAYTGEKLAKDATITIEQAKAAALKARPGKVTDEELESESGGSGLRYSFDITSDGKTYEVGVDAKSGDILENAAEGANPD